MIEYKGRLTRFGFNYLAQLWNVEIVVINTTLKDEKDLISDFASIITSFCVRLYGRRRTHQATEKLIRELKDSQEIKNG